MECKNLNINNTLSKTSEFISIVNNIKITSVCHKLYCKIDEFVDKNPNVTPNKVDFPNL